MSVDFFSKTCQESPRTDNKFGLCDDQNGQKAYTDITDESKWIAYVKNDNKIKITFTAIDNCIIILKEGTKDKESTCDGMLTFTDSLYLIELKKQGTGGWGPTAIGQLENTIKILIAIHDVNPFKYKKAFACNKKHPHFQTVDNELNKRFFREFGFRIDVQAEIVINS